MKITTMRDIREILVEGERVSVEFPKGYERVTFGEIKIGDMYYSREERCFKNIPQREIGCSVVFYIYVIRSTKPVKEKVEEHPDTKRMDWLQKHIPRLDVKSGKVWVCCGYTANKVSSGKTLREAIDNGMQKEMTSTPVKTPSQVKTVEVLLPRGETETVKIEAGYRWIKSGKVQKGDRKYYPCHNGFMNVEPGEVGFSVKNYICVIRKIDKGMKKEKK